MNSKYEEAKEASKQNLEETQDIPTMVCVQEHNWLALISQLKLLTDTTDETVPAKSAENIRSAAGTGEGDTGADVTKRDGRGVEAGSGGEGPRITGWEAERADLIAAEMLRRAEQEERLQTAHSRGSDRAPAPDIVGGIAAVASIIEDEPADDTEYAREHVDSKALAEERERKEAHGIHMG